MSIVQHIIGRAVRSRGTQCRDGRDRMARGALLVGFDDPRKLLMPRSLMPRAAPPVALNWAELSLTMIRHLQPDLVISPLFTERFDAIELALRLDRAGYGGRYAVLLPADLPAPDLVAREIRAQSTRFSVELHAEVRPPRIDRDS